MTTSPSTVIPVTVVIAGHRHGASGLMTAGIILASGGYEKELSLTLGVGSREEADIRAALAALATLRAPDQTMAGILTDSRTLGAVIEDGQGLEGLAPLCQELRALAARCRSVAVVSRPHRAATLLARAAALARAAVGGGNDAQERQRPATRPR